MGDADATTTQPADIVGIPQTEEPSPELAAHIARMRALVDAAPVVVPETEGAAVLAAIPPSVVTDAPSVSGDDERAERARISAELTSYLVAMKARDAAEAAERAEREAIEAAQAAAQAEADARAAEERARAERERWEHVVASLARIEATLAVLEARANNPNP